MSEWEITLCEVLSEFPQHVLPLPCNVCISVTSGRHHSDNSHDKSHKAPLRQFRVQKPLDEHEHI